MRLIIGFSIAGLGLGTNGCRAAILRGGIVGQADATIVEEVREHIHVARSAARNVMSSCRMALRLSRLCPLIARLILDGARSHPSPTIGFADDTGQLHNALRDILT